MLLPIWGAEAPFDGAPVRSRAAQPASFVFIFGFKVAMTNKIDDEGLMESQRWEIVDVQDTLNLR